MYDNSEKRRKSNTTYGYFTNPNYLNNGVLGTSHSDKHIIYQTKPLADKKLSKRPWLLILAVVIFVILITLIGVTVYYSTNVATKDPTSNHQLTAVFKLNWNWNDDLQNSQSKAFTEYQRRVCSQIEDFFSSGDLRSQYSSCRVSSFSEGSVIAQSAILFNTDSILMSAASQLKEAVDNKQIFNDDLQRLTFDDGGTNQCPGPPDLSCQHACTDEAYAYSCSCRDGYKLSSNNHTCTDIDECDTSNKCSHKCTNILGSYRCECDIGFQLSNDNINCIDINECTSNNGMCTDICRNTVGSYICDCNAGYYLSTNGATCLDTDECQGNTHGCGSHCQNTPGSYNCYCDSGYTLNSDNNICIDINECLVNNGNCNHQCNNTDGSYHCMCSSGYTLGFDGLLCIDIDECLDHKCEQICDNIDGSYNCVCEQGYVLDQDMLNCNDTNECLQNNGGCEHNCVNTNGSFYCRCINGYTEQGLVCIDTNECLVNNGNCDHQCSNTVGSYQCQCSPGYSLGLDGFICIDRNECTEHNGECSQVCINTAGSYFCNCSKGFVLMNDGFNCTDVDECLDGDLCEHVCLNTEGSYTCECPAGFTPHMDSDDKIQCIDIDECMSGTSGCEHICTNTLGSYSCACNNGTILKRDLHNCTGCQLHEYECGDGKCISGRYLCDDYNDCTDGGDETGCPCHEAAHRCIGTNKCITPDKVCDGQNHCDDYSDEFNCSTTQECDNTTSTLCNDGTCLTLYHPASTYCNQVKQCPDGSDEPPQCSCREDQFRCTEHDICLPKSSQCNSISDCLNAKPDPSQGPIALSSDEQGCPCPPGDFRCNNGQCILPFYVCDVDEVGNCLDFSDQLNCRSTCESTHFTCADKTCVHVRSDEVYCNGIVSCPDGSDEPPNCECRDTQFQCKTNTTICIPMGDRCNKRNKDCPDNSDEMDCPCETNEIRCDNDNCVRKTTVCDGKDDCGDGSDEKNCDCHDGLGFICPNGNCITQAKKCDAYNDCGDYGDEVDCPCPLPDKYLCPGTNVCINKHQLCNTRDECGNNADEVDCPCHEFYHCDGKNDCNWSDEVNCNGTGVCDSSQFHCENGDCVSAHYDVIWCNGVTTCNDSSDEPDGCDCRTSQFRCVSDGKCIPLSQKCDVTSHCSDHSDETGCPCGSGLFQCVSNGLCLPGTYRCDKKFDCDDNSDEADCDCEHKCNDTGLCINEDKVCNTDFDCDDHSDEANCDYCNQPEYFQCNFTDTCIPIAQRCDSDSIKHCLHGEDELYCTCPFDSVRCRSSGKCISKDFICDGHIDCEGREDEMHCNSCAERSCSQYSGCYSYTARCDGQYHCGDKSDEQFCYNIMPSGVEEDLVLVQGRPLCYSPLFPDDAYNNICSQRGLGKMKSISTVSTGDLSYTEFKDYNMNKPPLLFVEYNYLYFMDNSTSCASGSVVKVTCEQHEAICGRPKLTERLPVPMIVNGDKAAPGAWPWQVSVQRSSDNFHQCGGTLINEFWVVTAAHCIPSKASDIVIGAGSTKLDSKDITHYEVSAVFKHPNFSSSALKNDIGLVHLKTRVPYSDHVLPACLPESKVADDLLLESFTECFVSGWGKQSTLVSGHANDLQESKMQIRPVSDCNNHRQNLLDNPDNYDNYDGTLLDTYTWEGLIDKLPTVNSGVEYCVGYLSGLSVFCYGDSGGPLVCQKGDNRWTLVGAVSWGVYCQSYGVFTKVPAFLPWIEDIVNG